MKLFWIMCFFRGIALLGAQRQLINLLIFEQNNEFELGKITSVISIITIILFYGFGKFVSSKQYKRVLLLSTVLQLVSVFALIILPSKSSIIFLNFCFTSCLGIIGIIIDNIFYTMANAYPEYKPEFLVTHELFANAGRIASWIIAIISISIGDSSSLSVSILLINIAFILMIYIISKMLKEKCYS